MNPIFLAVFAYGWWGFVPLYWKLLSAFAASELILYRVVLSSIFLIPYFFPRKRRNQLKELFQNPKALAGLFLSGSLIGFNWFLYVWAVNANHVIETSLGYFLNPLVNVALGTFFLKERMRPPQKVACFFAFSGALALTIIGGRFPWIAILLAVSFGLYGLVRKTLKVPTVGGTMIETLLLTAPCLMGLYWLFQSQDSHLMNANGQELTLLFFCGLVTTIPLLAFAEAAKALPLSMMGFFQFIAPSIQFLLGLFVFHEPFGILQWLSFTLIWIGLGIFVVEGLLRKTK